MATLLGKIVADFETTLATELAVGGTTATLQSIVDDDGNNIPNGTYYFTLDGDNADSSLKEHIQATVTGTALSAIKTVSRQGVTASGAVRKHRIGATVKITDFAHIKYMNDLLAGTTDLNASVPLKYDGTATISNANHLATKDYVDGVAVAGAPDASETVKGNVEIATGAELAAGTGTGGTGAVIVAAGSSFKNSSAGAGDANKVPVLDANGVLDQTFLNSARTWGAVQSFTADNCQITTDANSANDATRQSYVKAELSKGYTTGIAGETLAVGEAVYIKAADSRLWKADTDADESTFSFVGIIVTGGNAGDTVYYARPGDVATGLSLLTVGSSYYLTATAGAIGTTPGSRYADIGIALSTTTLQVRKPSFVVSGSQTASSVTTYVQTTGFYPARILINAGSAGVGGQIAGVSIGDDTNKCVIVYPSGVTGSSGYSATKAWYTKNSGSTVNSGTVSAKSATGFTLDCDTAGGNAEIYWTAFSE